MGFTYGGHTCFDSLRLQGNKDDNEKIRSRVMHTAAHTWSVALRAASMLKGITVASVSGRNVAVSCAQESENVKEGQCVMNDVNQDRVVASERRNLNEKAARLLGPGHVWIDLQQREGRGIVSHANGCRASQEVHLHKSFQHSGIRNCQEMM